MFSDLHGLTLVVGLGLDCFNLRLLTKTVQLIEDFVIYIYETILVEMC